MARIKTPVIQYGGKTLIADLIVQHLPPHMIWVDVFGGGAAVTLAKAPSGVEVYNDIGNVAEFFRVLRENENELYRRLKYTLWSREEFDDAVLTWEREPDPIEKARKWLILIDQGFTHEEENNSWLVSKGVNTAKAWCNHVEVLPMVVDRFRNIIIEHSHFKKIFDIYDGTDVLFYCDPPYLQSTRKENGGGYKNEMLWFEHKRMLEFLTSCKAQVVVSGYPSKMYSDMLKDWRYIQKERLGQIRNSSQSRTTRTECIWIRENDYGTLWSQSPESGTCSDVPEIRAAGSSDETISIV